SCRRDQLERTRSLALGHRTAERRQGGWQASASCSGATRNNGAFAGIAEQRTGKPRLGRESEFLLWHGPDGLVLPRPPFGGPRWRLAGISLTDLDHAKRFDRSYRAGHRRPRRPHVQRSHLQHLRASAWLVTHSMVGAPQRDPS